MSKKKNVKVKPGLIGWFIYITCSTIFSKFKNRVKINKKAFKNRNKKEGCIVIYNHSCKYDHFFTTAAFGFTRASYVISTHFYFNKLLRVLLKWVRTIPKEQFKSDISTIKKIKRAVQSGVPVAIAPTGQITMHGEQLFVSDTIVKLLKMCNVDVYAIELHGTYFAYPKWRKYPRNVPIHVDFVKVFDKEELKTLSDDEIYRRVCNSINVNDRLEQPIYKYKLKSKGLVEGLETVIHQCPKCFKKEVMATSKDIIYCTSCGNKARMLDNGYLEGIGDHYTIMNTETVWYNWQKQQLVKEILEGNLHIEGNFKLLRNINKPYKLDEVGTGKLVLTNNELYYEGTLNGSYYKKEFKLSAISQFPFEPHHHFDIPDDEGCFEFLPAEGEKFTKIIRFVQAVETLYTLRNEA